MSKILTQDGLRDYIKRQLGAPSITIEVTDDQIDDIIYDAIQKFTEYAYGTLEDTVLIELNGAGDYQLPNGITNIISFNKGGGSSLTNFGANFGAGYVPNIWSEQYFSGNLTGNMISTVMSISNTRSQLEKFFGDDLSINFNPYKGVLKLLENYTGTCVLHYQYEYQADEFGDGIYNHEWIKAYTKAKTKELWSTVTGKFDQALVGGARINYDKMAQEAERDIEKLEEELLTKWSDPAPIDIG